MPRSLRRASVEAKPIPTSRGPLAFGVSPPFLPIRLSGDLPRRSAAMFAQTFAFECGHGVGDHLRVAAEHAMGVFRREGDADPGLQSAIGKGGGMRPENASGAALTGHERDVGQGAAVFLR